MTGAFQRGDWLQTYTGRAVWPFDPTPESIAVEDIAHALAMICRFGGHCCAYYSVAEHSLLVASQVSPPTRLAALLHDAAEAYLGDMPRPLKPRLHAFCDAEDRLQTLIYNLFGIALSAAQSAEIKHADEVALATEAAHLMAAPPMPWVPLPDALPAEVLQCLSPMEAEAAFLRELRALLSARDGGASAARVRP